MNFTFKKRLSLLNLVDVQPATNHNRPLSVTLKPIYMHLFNSQWKTTNSLKVHYSFNNLYYFNSKTSIGFFNLNKLENVVLNFFTFLKNIFFFNVKYSIFTNSFLKYEAFSMNSKNLPFIKFLFKYSNPFIYFISNKATIKTDFFFQYILKNNVRVTFIIDIFYHKKTIHYISKHKFISLGPVPISSSLYTLNVSLPLINNSSLSNLTFLKLLLLENKRVLMDKFLLR